MEPGPTPDVTNAAVGGTDALKALQSIDNELALFPGEYVVLAYGTNDYPPTFAMESLVQRVITAGKTPVVPVAPWNDYPLTISRTSTRRSPVSTVDTRRFSEARTSTVHSLAEPTC